jgi:hypothetical protein
MTACHEQLWVKEWLKLRTRTELYCQECNARMLLVEIYKLCPNGCGRLIMASAAEKMRLRRIKVNPRT